MPFSGHLVPSGLRESRPPIRTPPSEPEEYYHGSTSYLDHSTGFPSTGSGSVGIPSEDSENLHETPRYGHSTYFQYGATSRVEMQPEIWAATFPIPQIVLDTSQAVGSSVANSSYTNNNTSSTPRSQTQSSSPISFQERPHSLGPSAMGSGPSPFNEYASFGNGEYMGTLPPDDFSDFSDFGGPSSSQEDDEGFGFMEDVRSTGTSTPVEHLSRAPSPQYGSNEDQFMWSNVSLPHESLSTDDYDAFNVGLRPPTVGENSNRMSASPRNPEKRSSSRTREQIDKAKAIREARSCIRCQILHKDCGLSAECLSCRIARDNGTIWRIPCLRARLSDARLYRSGSLMFPDGVVPKLKAWALKPNLTISLYHAGFVESPHVPQDRPRVEIICREFIPRKVPQPISMSKSWISRGKKVDFVLPPYAIPSGQLKKMAERLDLLLENHWPQLASELINSQGDRIVSSTLKEAARNSGKCKMLKGALDIAIISRLISKSFSLAGQETFGLSPVMDPDSPYYGRIPNPPFLDAQLDDLLMRRLKKVQKGTLVELNNTMLGSNKRRDWFMIFLTILVLLSNLEFVYQNQDRQMKRYHTFQRISSMDHWIQSAQILNTYFHEICHGEIPFYMDWTYEAQKVRGIDNQALEFLANLKDLLISREAELRRRAHGPPEHPLVWISALFLPQQGT